MALALWDGFIFVNLAQEPIPFAQHLDGLDQRFASWALQDLRAVERRTYQLRANWKLIVSNYHECLHCPVAHPQLQRLSHYLSGDNEPPRPTYLGSRMELREGIATLSGEGPARRAPLPGLQEEERRNVYYYAILPNMLLNLHPDYVVTFRFDPRAADHTDIECEWLFHPSEIDKPGFDPVRCGRVLGRHQPPGLGAVRPGPGRDQLTRLPARSLFQPGGDAGRVRPLGARAGRPLPGSGAMTSNGANNGAGNGNGAVTRDGGQRPYRSRYDVVVVGGGHNGLVAAAYLARAGRKVLVLERRHLVGGAAVTEEVFPGFKFSVFSYVVSLLRPEIIRELDLPRHGLEILPLDGTFTPMPDGNYLWRMNDHARTRREIARHSRLDAEAYEEYGKAMVEMGRFVKPILGMTPPDPTSLRPSSLLQLLALGKRFGALSAEAKYNQVQLLTKSAVDLLDQWFETDVLKATMAASGIIGTFQGVRSPGTAYVLLHHYMGEIDGAFRSWGLPRGGHRCDLQRHRRRGGRGGGGDLHRRAGGPHPDEERRRRAGWCWRTATRSGPRWWPRASIRALTFGRLVGSEHLPDDFAEDISRYKFRGSSGKVNLALDALPDFRCLPGPGAHLRGAISISPSVDYMERAFDEAKYGRFSRRPYIDIVIPSLTDPCGGAAGQTRDVLLRAIRALRPEGGDLGREPQGLRRHGDRYASPNTPPTSRTSSCTGRCSPRSTSNGRPAFPRGTSSRAS